MTDACAKLVLPRAIGVSMRTRRPEAIARWNSSVISGRRLFLGRQFERASQLPQHLELPGTTDFSPTRR